MGGQLEKAAISDAQPLETVSPASHRLTYVQTDTTKTITHTTSQVVILTPALAQCNNNVVNTHILQHTVMCDI